MSSKSGLPRVIYIMGTGRSGTTILEMLLAQAPGVFGAGEMTELPSDGWQKNQECSCGQPFAKCGIWSAVHDRMALTQGEVEQWKLQQRAVDWHFGFLRHFFIGLPAKFVEGYSSNNRRLLESVSVVSGDATIVDSSKYAGRALALERYLDADITVICMTRSPAGILASFRKAGIEQRSKSVLSALGYYIFVMTCLRMAALRLKGRITYVTLDELMVAPDVVLQRIEQECNVDLSGVRKTVLEGGGFSTGHVISGNRLRQERQVRFDPIKAQQKPPVGWARIVVLIMEIWRRALHF